MDWKIIVVFGILLSVLFGGAVFLLYGNSETNNPGKELGPSDYNNHKQLLSSASYRVTTKILIDRPGGGFPSRIGGTIVQEIDNNNDNALARQTTLSTEGERLWWSNDTQTLTQRPFQEGTIQQLETEPYAKAKVLNGSRPAFSVTAADPGTEVFSYSNVNFTRTNKTSFNGKDVTTYKANSTALRERFNNTSTYGGRPEAYVLQNNVYINQRLSGTTASEAAGTAYVNNNGVIVYWRIEVTLQSGNRQGTLLYERSVTDIGNVTLEEPPWVSNSTRWR